MELTLNLRFAHVIEVVHISKTLVKIQYQVSKEMTARTRKSPGVTD